MYGDDALANPDYGHMVNRKHYDRVCGLIDAEKDGRVLMGGRRDDETLRIEPTVLDGVTASSPAMGEEIFGPVLPVMAYDDLDEALAFVKEHFPIVRVLSEPGPELALILTGVEGEIKKTLVHNDRMEVKSLIHVLD